VRTTAWAIKTKVGLVRPTDQEFWEVRVPLFFRTKKLAVEYLRTHVTYGKGVPVKVEFEVREVDQWRAT
jgi:hypothetical protein